MVGLCLPDETNLLNGHSDRRPRRILPSRPDQRPVYVTRPGASVGRQAGSLTIRKSGELLQRVRLIDVGQLCLFGRVQVSSQLLHELFDRDIPVAWFTSGGWFRGVGLGLPSGHVELRRKQVIGSALDSLGIARSIVRSKIRNQRTLLRRNARPRPESELREMARLAARVDEVEAADVLLGFEGMAARHYFGAFHRMLTLPLDGEAWAFEMTGRNRRPPTDPVNALLSFTYALLVKDLTAASYLVGFDPFLGFLHRPRFGRPALALDLAEEFRPLVADSTVIGMINNGEIREGHFVRRMGGVALTQDGRRKTIAAYERRLDVEMKHPIFGYKVSYRRMFDIQTRLLATCVMGEVDKYSPLETR